MDQYSSAFYSEIEDFFSVSLMKWPFL